jgi:hypothetical protein
MLDEDEPTIRYVSPRTGMRKGWHAANDVATNLRDFRAQRTALVQRLGSLPLGDWARQADFSGTRPGWTQTVFQVAAGIADHEHSHFEQIAAAAAAAATARTTTDR